MDEAALENGAASLYLLHMVHVDKSECGIYAVRETRGISNRLGAELK